MNPIIELHKYQEELNRERIRERQQQGIALAKENCRYTGRKPGQGAKNRRFRYKNIDVTLVMLNEK